MGDNSLEYTLHNDLKEVSVRGFLNTKQTYSCDAVITQQGLQYVTKSVTVIDMGDIDDWLHRRDILIISRFMRTYLTKESINTLHQKQTFGVITHKLYEEYITMEQKSLSVSYHISLIFIEDGVP